MSKVTIFLTSLTLFGFLSAQADDVFRADQNYGGDMPVEGKAITLKEAIADMNQGSEEFVKIKGQGTEVCQAKGCWMILVDGETYARVTFENYGFFVPIETSMQQSIVYGQLKEHVLTGEQAQHFAQDAGAKSSIELEGEVREYSIVARAVQLEQRG